MARLSFLLAIVIVPYTIALSSLYASETIGERRAYWESQALLCNAGIDNILFPSKQTGQVDQPCDDGDMTLFNGLLCAAGDKRGCIGVAEAQDNNSGQWFRSPRIRFHGNDRGGSSFSPDMALGAQLYLVSTADTTRAWKWLMWIEDNIPCAIAIGGQCIEKGLIPRFCTDDEKEKGCFIRPGDAAILAATVNWLQEKNGMPKLPDGSRLRGYLGTFSGYASSSNEIAAKLNEPGFPQHLVGVSIMLLRKIGISDVNLDNAARTLQKKNPGNAFFSYIAEGPTNIVMQELEQRCPMPGRPTALPHNQWQWERENQDMAWIHSAYWDCIFIAELLDK